MKLLQSTLNFFFHCSCQLSVRVGNSIPKKNQLQEEKFMGLMPRASCLSRSTAMGLTKGRTVWWLEPLVKEPGSKGLGRRKGEHRASFTGSTQRPHHTAQLCFLTDTTAQQPSWRPVFQCMSLGSGGGWGARSSCKPQHVHCCASFFFFF